METTERRENVRIQVITEMSLFMIHFTFDKDLTYAHLQFFAKTVKCMMLEEFSFENSGLLDICLPDGIVSLEELNDICLKNKDDATFYVSTPSHPEVEYVSRQSRQIPNLETNLYLNGLQISFDEYKENRSGIDYLSLADRMLVAFICINTDITNYFFFKANDKGVFNWDEKYKPCLIDIERLRRFKGQIALAATEKSVKKDLLKDSVKGLFMDFAYQCGFLAFWSCLLDVLTCPCCTSQEKEVLGNLVQFILKNYSNIYVYHLVVEADCIKGGDKIETRGSAENTTRVKMYFTMADDRPVLMRLDLPHEGHPYVHINIDDGVENIHVPLSEVVVGDEYDHVFDELQSALLKYNFNATKYYHSPVAKDKEIMKDMRYRTAILNYSICAFFYTMIGNATKICHDPVIINARATLEELLESDGFKKVELAELSPNDILGMAMNEIKE